jgi:Tfp pilus assembly protein PilF
MSSLIEVLLLRLADGRDSATLRFGLGKALLDATDTERAIVHLREAVRQDPGYSAAWAQIGRCELRRGCKEDAIEAWRQGYSIAKAQGNEQAKRQMASWLRRTGVDAEAAHG